MSQHSSTRRDFLQTIPLGLATAAAAGSLLGQTTLAGAAEPSEGKKLGFALVGLGSLAGNQIAPALLKTRHCQLTGLVSGHPDKAAQWAEKYGVAKKNIYNYDNFDRIADNPDIDVIYVVLPNSMHAEYTIRAAKAGKHVLCEKPMAISVSECDQMIDACQKAQRLLAIGYRLHFEPHHNECVRLAREKTYGPVKLVQSDFGFKIGDPKQWRLNKKLAGGGALMDVGIYALQFAHYIIGEEPNTVMALETKTDPVKFKEVDESISFSLTFPGGGMAICGTSYATGFNRARADADNGWFELDPAYSYDGLKGSTSDGKPLQFPEIDQFAAEMDDFAQCIANKQPSRVSGEEGRRDLKVLEAVYQSIEQGKLIRLG